MKPITTLILIISMLINIAHIQAQYYMKSRKNKALLITNTYTPDSTKNKFFHSIEYGREFKRLLLHGGLSASTTINIKQSKSSEYPTPNKEILYNGIAGAEMKLIGFELLNLSHSSYCKYLVGFLSIGFDGFKNLNSSINQDYGYRAKAYLSMGIIRGGSHKKDIGYRRFIEIGYCYSDNNLSNKKNTPQHSIMLNFLIIKQRLIKFADWY